MDTKKFYVKIFIGQKWLHQKTYSPNKPILMYMSYVPSHRTKKLIKHFALATNVYEVETAE